MQVQEEIARRANLKTGKADGGKRIYSSKYALSSIVFCGECGDIYRRIHWNNRGKKSVVWRCVGRLNDKESDCGSATILEDTAEIDSQLVELQEQIVTAANRKEDYNALVDEILRLREERQSVQEYNANRQGRRQRIVEMTAFLNEQTCEMTEYDDKLVRQLVERVDVLGEKMTVAFKSGLEIEVE